MTITISKDFVKRNWIYLVWFCFYFFIAWLMFGLEPIAFILLAVSYAISITIALSPIGEKLLRVLNNTRKLETRKEKEYLIPIFEDVYSKVKEQYPNISDNIEICIIDAMYINAFAIGKRTIAVTRGACSTISEEALRGLIAHEFGHIYHGDTRAILLSTIGNGIFTIGIMSTRLILNLIDLITAMVDRIGFVRIIMIVTKILGESILFVFLYIGQVILSINSRSNEYEADIFAYELGYGSELIEVLYLLHEMTISDKAKLYEKLKASHPHIAKRIGKLETLVYDE